MRQVASGATIADAVSLWRTTTRRLAPRRGAGGDRTCSHGHRWSGQRSSDEGPLRGGLHVNADTRIQQALSRGVDHEAPVEAVGLGRRFPTIDQSYEVWRDHLTAAYAEFQTTHGHRPERPLA